MNDGSLLVGRIEAAASEQAPAVDVSSSRRLLGLPLLFTLALAVMALRADAAEGRVREAFWGAAALLLLWNAGLAVEVLGRGRRLAVNVVVRKQHYLQACAQGTVLLYWGYYWRGGGRCAHICARRQVCAPRFAIL